MIIRQSPIMFHISELVYHTISYDPRFLYREFLVCMMHSTQMYVCGREVNQDIAITLCCSVRKERVKGLRKFKWAASGDREYLPR